MGRLFGTDGIRDKAHEGFLTQDNLVRFGRVVGYWLKDRNLEKDKVLSVLMARDTRESGYWIEQNIAEGLLAMGIRVVRGGVFPTPGLAFLTRNFNMDLGIMISASHNPWTDNGIKLLSGAGKKITDQDELQIEDLIFSKNIDGLLAKAMMKEKEVQASMHGQRFYIDFLKELVRNVSLKGKKIALDCANGAHSEIAPKVFTELGAEVAAVCCAPDGKNINEKCGSLHPEVVAGEAKKQGADFGFTFDGDGDRCIMVDGRGNVYDGDFMIAMAAKDMMKNHKLPKNTVVTTQMANVGLDIALKNMGAQLVRTDVGDKYVLEEMLKNGYKLGGEQSGHIIFLNYSIAGDGLITALLMSKMIVDSKEDLQELASIMKKMPQVLINIRVKEKVPFENMQEVQEKIDKYASALEGAGRVFVRYSGTESLARVMIEGPDKESIESMANSIAEAIKIKIGKA